MFNDLVMSRPFLFLKKNFIVELITYVLLFPSLISSIPPQAFTILLHLSTGYAYICAFVCLSHLMVVECVWKLQILCLCSRQEEEERLYQLCLNLSGNQKQSKKSPKKFSLYLLTRTVTWPHQRGWENLYLSGPP